MIRRSVKDALLTLRFSGIFLFPLFLGQYPAGAVAGSPTGVAPSPQHQMPITSQPQAEMYGVQMNGSGMGAEYQTGTNVGANVQSQVSSKGNCLSISCNRGLTLLKY